MKGISHFITGVAIATFFPEVVRAGGVGSLLPMLGGIGGILPDTIDFKFARYWEKFDVEIDPGLEPDAEKIADALVAAMRQAYKTGKDVNLVAHTIRVGADLWREYAIRFIPDSDEIAVRIGPLVNTGQVPLARSEPEGAVEVRRKVGVPVRNTYSEEYKVNIFSGPTFRFAREGASEREGEQVRVPIGGTIDKPRLAEDVVQKVVADIIKKAASRTIQKEIEKGAEKLLRGLFD